MKNIYCISGLGADERFFKHLKIKNTQLKHLTWPEFEDKETMETYAMKISSQIEEKHPIILGLSFGGMLATEITKQRRTAKTFLISSAKGRHELPDLSSVLAYLLKTGIIPYGLLKQPNKILFDRFGAETEDEKKVLRDILEKTKTDYLRHAFKVILNWKNETVPQNIVHLHGTHDKILPAAFVMPNYWIQGGTHMMMWNRADAIAAVIEMELKDVA